MLMLRPAQYLVIGLSALLLTLALLVGYHYKADRWGVFASDFESFHKRIFVNKLYLKTRYLLTREHDYRCFVFGSSRVVALDVKRLGEHCYNFSHSGGLVADHLRAVETLLDAGIPISEVYIGLDDLAYNEDPSQSQQQHMRRGYPRNVSETAGFLSLFLLKPFDITDFALVTGKKPKEPTPRFILEPDLDTERVRSMYQKFYDQPEQTDKRFRRLEGTGEGTVYHGDATRDALVRLKQLAAEHDFSLRAFFLPLHYKTYLTRDYDAYLRFKRDAAEIIPFVDFTGLNAYTTDNRYWRETSHFSATVGDQILYGVMAGSHPDQGNGRLTRAETLESLERSQAALDLAHLPRLLRREGSMELHPRFVSEWRRSGRLSPVALSPRGDTEQAPVALAEGGRVDIVRADGAVVRHAAVAPSLGPGDFFVISYEIVSEVSSQYSLTLYQDEALYGGKTREHRINVQPGRNRGALAGFTSVENPLIRLRLGGGDIHATLAPLQVARIELSDSERQMAESYVSGSGGGQ